VPTLGLKLVNAFGVQVREYFPHELFQLAT